MPSVAAEIARVVAGEHRNPHQVLGVHAGDGGHVEVRTYRPDAESVTVVVDDGTRVPATRVHAAGVFVVRLEHSALLGLRPAQPQERRVPGYRLETVGRDGRTFCIDDPYRFGPTLGELDLHLIGEGRHEALWKALGAHVREHEGVRGTSFAVWAPNARAVRVVGDFDEWDGRLHPMRSLGGSGVWELFLPGVGDGARYKYEIVTPDRRVILKADPMAFAAEEPPATASVVFESHHEWTDHDWLALRATTAPYGAPMSVYEVHLGSWHRIRDVNGERHLTYREAATELAEYVLELGFTHVQFMPLAEHPFGGSWGYQVSGYFAPTARYGTPDDFRHLVDTLHERGVGVIVDWVPAHFPKDEFALARFDGTALYEHADPRRGEHPDWGTLVFDYGRNEVRNFLVANAVYWCKELHVDGLRVDAVASMLYLDYSRADGRWAPNEHGGRENLEAIAFLREMNEAVYRECPGATTIAEESTAWPLVSRPTHVGGLGFGFKWNMGWMNDTLAYFAEDPVHRRFHHHQLTFGLTYAFFENFVLPLSHDEVVHGKGSLLTKMPGDRGQQLANLRSLLGWMWAHPGKQILFMGGEIAQEREWSDTRALDWHLLDQPGHRGIRDLVRELNEIYGSEPALYERDFDPAGFRWIDADDAEQSVLSFLRASADGSRLLACVANLTPVPREVHRLGLPVAGRWDVVLDTDDARFGGSGVGCGDVLAGDEPHHGFPHSGTLRLPPLAVVWLRSPRPLL